MSQKPGDVHSVDANVIESHDSKPSIISVKRAIGTKIWTEIDLPMPRERAYYVVVVLPILDLIVDGK